LIYVIRTWQAADKAGCIAAMPAKGPNRRRGGQRATKL
jgi:hypothetical protein